MPLRSSLKIHGVNGDADAFEVSFALDDVEAQMPPSGATQKLSFDVNDLKTSAAVSSDIVSSELASNEIVSSDIVSSDIVSSDIASSAALSDTSAAAAAMPVPASSPLHYFIKIGDIKGDSTVKGFEG